MTQRGAFAGSTDRRDGGTDGPFPGTGSFLAGPLVREVLRVRELSNTQRVFLTALTIVLVGLPRWSPVKWARSSQRPAPGAAVQAAALCVVVGCSWLAALVPVLLALSSVVVTKGVGGGVVLVAVVAVVFAVSLPRPVFWSWTGVDRFASPF